MAKYGCPFQVEKQGNKGNDNGFLQLANVTFSHSEGTLLHGPWQASLGFFRLSVCSFEELDRRWKPGRYCLMASTSGCPKGFQAISQPLVEETEDLRVESGGDVSAFSFSEHGAFIETCCRDDGPVSTFIDVPIQGYFSLPKVPGASCQRMAGFYFTEETISIQHNLSLHLCSYYAVNDSYRDTATCEEDWVQYADYCFYLNQRMLQWDEAREVCLRKGAELPSYHSLQEKDWLLNWVVTIGDPPPYVIEWAFEDGFNQAWITRHMPCFWVGLNDHTTENVWVFSDGTPYNSSLSCFKSTEPNDYNSAEDCQEIDIKDTDNPACNDQGCYNPRRSVCKKLRVAKEARQIELTTFSTRQSSTEYDFVAALATDILYSESCSMTTRQSNPWWQINLEQETHIYALLIVKDPLPESGDAFLRISVGDLDNDFLLQGALICNDDVTLMDTQVAFVRCASTIKGKYLTIEKYSKVDTSDHLVLGLCELKLYGRVEQNHRPLGLSSGEISAVYFEASSYITYHFAHFARLSSSKGWCAQPNDAKPWIQIRLPNMNAVSRLLTKGVGNDFVSKFTLTFKDSNGDWVSYLNAHNITKIFDVVQPISTTEHYLSTVIVCDIIQLNVLKYIGSACMRVELIGYQIENGGATQSLIGFPSVLLPQQQHIGNACIYIMSDWTFSSDGTLRAFKYIMPNNSGNEVEIAILRPIENQNLFIAYKVSLSHGDDTQQLDFKIKSGDIIAILTNGHTFTGLTYGTVADNIAESKELSNVMILSNGCQNSTIALATEASHTTAKMAFALTAIFESALKSGSCDWNITNESTIKSPNYPNYYGAGIDCIWRITAPQHLIVRLDFDDVDLFTRTYDITADDWETKECQDTVSIETSSDGNVWQLFRTMTAQEKALIITNANLVKVTLHSCNNLLWTESRGFSVKIQFIDTPGCGVGFAQISELSCTHPSAYLASENYPGFYTPNTKSSWKITVEFGKFVAVEFLSFDVSTTEPQCLSDRVEMYDIDRQDRKTLIDRLCNLRRPIDKYLASWNLLEVDFITDSSLEGSGFLIIYQGLSFNMEDDMKNLIQFNSLDCPPSWINLPGFCYSFQILPSITWPEAERVCQSQSSHLVSIIDITEMTLLQYLLTTNWLTNNTQTYIGLSDQEQESMFWWSDGRPMVYNAWSRVSDKVSEPDGGSLENCVLIELGSLHGLNHWKDIPCSYNLVDQFICKKPIRKDNSSLQHEDDFVLKQVNKEALPCPVETFHCDNGECVLDTAKCDNITQCSDGSDEIGCDRTGCFEDEFSCTSTPGACVQISYVCDFKKDCQDGSDENFCVYQQCSSEEFECSNHQCISKGQRCDILIDCLDGSDEIGCAVDAGSTVTALETECSTESTYKCYLGTCIPQSAFCDGIVDCNGKIYEDEVACAYTAATSCGDWLLFGFYTGDYIIRPGGYGSVAVRCEMDAPKATSIFGIETLIIVSEASLGLNNQSHEIIAQTYRMDKIVFSFDNQPLYILSKSSSCVRDITIQCTSACIEHLQLQHIGKRGKVKEIPLLTIPNCMCNSLSAQSDNRSLSKEDVFTMYNDDAISGRIWSLTWEKIALNGDISIIPQRLRCLEDVTTGNRPSSFQCNNGQYTEDFHRCIMEFDDYGHHIGCRDGSHLIGCDTYKQLDKECRLEYLGLEYKGTQYRTKNNNICQRWTQQLPHTHQRVSAHIFADKTVAEAENFCRNTDGPQKITDVPLWCYTMSSNLRYEPCDIPMCDPSIIGKTLPFDCPAGYVQCQKEKFCIPVRYVCDGKWHCPDGEDETQCGSYVQEGFYKCEGQNNYLPNSQVCDGKVHCKNGDDEQICDIQCPSLCECVGFYYNCSFTNINDTSIFGEISNFAKKIDISYNNILQLFPSWQEKFVWLVEFIVVSNHIKDLKKNSFINMENLRILDLRYNELEVLVLGTFTNLINLKELRLNGNRIQYIEPGAFVGLSHIEQLDLSKQFLFMLDDHVFVGLEKLKELQLQENQIKMLHLRAFDSLPYLTTLNISSNHFSDANASTFSDVTSLEQLETDNFKFCCFAYQVMEENCLPPQDEISSCQDLMRNNTLRTLLWILGALAFLGNAFVVSWRLAFKFNTVHDFLVFNLGISDFLMGLYMLGIGAVDVFYRNVYIQHADTWKTSALCQVLGLLATMSSEGSVMFLVAISTDILINIVSPFSSFKLSMSKAKIVTVVCWLISFILGIIPVFPINYFDGKFYSRSGVCVGLPLTKYRTAGWEYSAAMFLVFNLFGMVMMMFSYLIIYFVVTQSGKHLKSAMRRQRATPARKMMIIVATDFLCWFPIIIMGFLALGGTPIPGEVYAWTIAFILPVNSAINPILYTISSLDIKQKIMKFIKGPEHYSAKKKVSKLHSSNESTSNTLMLCHPGNIKAQSLQSYIRFDGKSMTCAEALKLIVNLFELVAYYHKSIGTHGNIRPNSVMVKTSDSHINVYLAREDADTGRDDLDPSTDVMALGQLVKTLLRHVTQAQNTSDKRE